MSVKINELTTKDSVLDLPIGTKFMECVSAGITYKPCKQAYGTWEFKLNKGNDINTLVVFFISENTTSAIDGGKYVCRLKADESFEIRRYNVGTSVSLIQTAASYISINTWYRIKITRSLDGEFTAYIKGGSFGKSYVLVDVTGGAGSNPATDNTHQTSNYLTLDLDAGDKITDFLFKDGIQQ